MQTIAALIKRKEQDLGIIEIEPRFKRMGWTAMANKIIFHKSLSIQAKALYWYFFARCFQKDNCFPGKVKIANDLLISERAVYNYVSELKKSNFLKIKRRGQGKTNVYILKF